MELKRIPKNTVIKGEEHWCHLSNAKEIDAPQINSNEVHLPCIGSIAIPRSTSYTTDVTFFTKIQRFHETPISSLEEHQFQESLRNKDPCTPYRLEMRADSLSSTAVISHLSRSTSSGFSLSYMYVTGTMVAHPFSNGSSRLRSPALQVDSLPSKPPGKPCTHFGLWTHL